MQTESKWRMQKKSHTPTSEGNCPYCRKKVKALEAHIHDKHKKELRLKKQWKKTSIRVRSAK